MASIYKRAQEQGRRRACWYIGYKDASGKRKTVKGFTDKSETERLAAEIEERERLVRKGLRHPSMLLEAESLAAATDQFRKHLVARDVSDKQVGEVVAKVERIINHCGWTTAREITAAKVESCLAQFRGEGMSKQTSNHYLRAIKQFSRWLVRTHRLFTDPVTELRMLNVSTDRRHDRRPLTIEEFSRLIPAAESGPSAVGIPGPDRAVMYVLAASTGLRRGEIGSLTLHSFNFDDASATVTVAAAHSKRRRKDTQILPTDVADYIRAWMQGKQPQPGQILFPVSERSGGLDRRTSEMMQKDLARARSAWLDEAETQQEREDREKSDFLAYRSRDGRYADFHATRHTFITNLGRAGVSPKTAQTLARHSDVRLTMNVYTHTDHEEKVAAVNRLPHLLGSSNNRPSVGAPPRQNDGAETSWECIGSAPESQTGTSGHLVAKKGTRTKRRAVEASCAQSEEESPLGVTCHQLSSPNESTPGGIRRACETDHSVLGKGQRSRNSVEEVGCKAGDRAPSQPARRIQTSGESVIPRHWLFKRGFSTGI